MYVSSWYLQYVVDSILLAQRQVWRQIGFAIGSESIYTERVYQEICPRPTPRTRALFPPSTAIRYLRARPHHSELHELGIRNEMCHACWLS